MLAACATPTQRIDVTAERLGMTKGLVEGLNFRHVTYAKSHSTTKARHS